MLFPTILFFLAAAFAAPSSRSPKPHILLAHGAVADGSSWSKVISILQEANYNVTAVQQPLSSIDDDIAVVKNGIKTINSYSDDPIVLVGHSYGGFIITNAAYAAESVKALVYVAAYAPDEGETAADTVSMFPTSAGAAGFAPVVRVN
jgi:pimeloyl-ACP methyl ester carboxylesterase